MRLSCLPVMPMACKTANSWRRVMMPVSTAFKKLSMPTSPMIRLSALPSVRNMLRMLSNSA